MEAGGTPSPAKANGTAKDLPEDFLQKFSKADVIRLRQYEEAVIEDFYAFHERQVGTKTGKTLKKLMKDSFEKGLSETTKELNVVRCG